MGSPTIFKGQFVKMLKSRIEAFNNWRLIVDQTTSPNVSATDARRGSILVQNDINNPDVFVKQDDGTTTKWKNLSKEAPSIIAHMLASEEVVGDFVTGNNAIFDNGGPFNGVFAVSTTPADLIKTNRVWRWVGHPVAGNNTNNFVVYPPKDIPQGSRGRYLSFLTTVKWDGGDDKIFFRVKDTTNGDILTPLGSTAISSHTPSDNEGVPYAFTVFIPSDCEQVEVGFQRGVGEASKILLWSEIIITEDAFRSFNASDISDWEAYTPTNTQGFGTIANNNLMWRRVGQNVEIQGTFDAGTTTAVEAQLELPNSYTVKTGFVLGHVGLVPRSQVSATATNQAALATGGDSYLNFAWAGSNPLVVQNANNVFATGDKISLKVSVPVNELNNANGVIVRNGAGANSCLRVVTQNGFGSINNKIRRFSTIDKDLGGAWTYSDSATAGASVTIKRDGQYTVSYVEHTAASQETAFGISLNSASLTTSIASLAVAEVLAISEVDADANANQYNTVSWTGQLSVGDVIRPHTDGNAATGALGSFTVAKIGTAQVTGVPIPERIFIHYEQANNVAGGNGSIGSYAAIPYNVIEGSFGSLAAGVLTLQAGTYVITGEQTLYRGDRSKVRMRDITNSTTVGYGKSVFADNAANRSSTLGTFKGQFTISGQTELQVENRVTVNGLAGFTLGVSTNLGEIERYGTVEIIKIG